MTEESLLINFDNATAPLATSSGLRKSIKGGRWKDRLIERKKSRRGPKSSLDRVESGAARLENEKNYKNSSSPQHKDSRSLKRKRQPEDNENGFGAHLHPERTHQNQLRAPRQQQNQHQQPPQQKQKQQQQEIISSLFTSGPVELEQTLSPSNAQEESTIHATPTNAPLQDGSEFSSLGLMPTLSSHLSKKLNLTAPTAIQRVAIPKLISSDSDAFIQAQTGSGKTLSYLLPLIHRMTFASSSIGEWKMGRDSGCFAIIMAPTRELGRQIHFVLNQVLSHPSLHWIVPILLLGGEKKKSEKARLRKGGNILVATPGRLADHLENTKTLDVQGVRWIILDEGDRLMDLGFETTIRTIFDKLNERCATISRYRSPEQPALAPKRRVTILCSATMQGNVQRLGELALSEALFLKAAQEGETKEPEGWGLNGEELSAPAQLQQSCVVTPAKLRLVTLAAILKRSFIRQKQTMRAIVFFSCADSVDFHFRAFGHSAGFNQDAVEDASESDEDGAPKGEKPEGKDTDHLWVPLDLERSVRLHKLHGSLKQPVRTATLSSFLRSKDANVLFCTDIAARGLDLPNVDLVLQYDPPFSKEDYLHRIGRTARAGRDGRAMIFLLPGSEEKYPDEVLKSMHISRKNATELLKLGFTPQQSLSKRRKEAAEVDHDFIPMTSGEPWAEEATRYHLEIERWVLAAPENLALARRGFQSFVRAYATHIAPERTIFDLKALHLGHIAKSFGLRDKPTDIKIKSVDSSGTQKTHDKHGESKADKHRVSDGDLDENAKRMRMKMKEHMSAISEFNIG